MDTIMELRDARSEAAKRALAAADDLAAALAKPDTTEERAAELDAALNKLEADLDRLDTNLRRAEKLDETRKRVGGFIFEKTEDKRDGGDGRGQNEKKGVEMRASLRQDCRVEVSEPLTYRWDNSDVVSFFGDLMLSSTEREGRGRDSSIRLDRHRQEMTELRKRAGVQVRAMSSTAGLGGELVTPIYLNDQFVPIARVGRPFANAIGSNPLPPNTNSLNIPRLATPTTVGAQQDGAQVSSTDATTNYLTIPVNTVAGQVDVSRQLLERATPGLDQILFPELVAALNAELDRELVTGSGVGGQMKGVLNASGTQIVTFTSGSPTVALLYPKFADAIYNRVAALLFRQADMVLMHPRRWGFHAASLDSSNRPLIVPTVVDEFSGPKATAFNPVGLIRTMAAQGFVGEILGLPVVVDANVPVTGGAGLNQDTIVVCRSQEFLFWEDTSGPYMKVFEQTLSNTLQIRLQAYQYAAFTAERYGAATALIQGTGLTPPTF